MTGMLFSQSPYVQHIRLVVIPWQNNPRSYCLKNNASPFPKLASSPYSHVKHSFSHSMRVFSILYSRVGPTLLTLIYRASERASLLTRELAASHERSTKERREKYFALQGEQVGRARRRRTAVTKFRVRKRRGKEKRGRHAWVSLDEFTRTEGNDST